MDVALLSFDEWTRFTFRHDVNHDNFWYLNPQNYFDVSAPVPILKNVIRLFQKPEFLLSSYTLDEIDQGFWFIPSPCGYMRLLLADSVPCQLKHDVIFHIYDLYENLFVPHLHDYTSPLMWWDSMFTYSIYDNKKLNDDEMLMSSIKKVLCRMENSTIPKMQEYSREGLKFSDGK